MEQQPELLTTEWVSDSVGTYLYQKRPKRRIIYIIVLAVVSAVVISLPFVYVDITVQSNGFVRPNGEISVITAPMTETVERVSAKEGDKLRKGDEILRFRTSSPDELAHKLHISKRHLYNVLDDLRVLGAKIDYSRSDYTFYYTNSFELHLNLQVEYLDENDKKMYFCRQFFI